MKGERWSLVAHRQPSGIKSKAWTANLAGDGAKLLKKCNNRLKSLDISTDRSLFNECYKFSVDYTDTTKFIKNTVTVNVEGSYDCHDRENNINPYQQEHNELWAALVNGEYKFADAENGARSTMTSILGRYATYSGKVITMDEAINSDINLFPDTLAWDATPKLGPNADGFYPHAIPGKTITV